MLACHTQSLGFGPSVGQEEHVSVPTGLALPYRTGLQPLAHPVGAGAKGSHGGIKGQAHGAEGIPNPCFSGLRYPKLSRPKLELDYT